LIKIDTKKK